MLRLLRPSLALAAALALGGAVGCSEPDTQVVVENDYPGAPSFPLVVYEAYWQAVSFRGPIFPGGSSSPQPTVPASANTAYALLAPGWDPSTAATPTALVVLQSNEGFSVHLDGHLAITVDNAAFSGDCAASSYLTQAQADFITQLVFPTAFAGLQYDPSTCTTTPTTDGGSREGGDP